MDPSEVAGAAAIAAKGLVPLGGVGIGLLFVIVFAAGVWMKGMKGAERDDDPKDRGHGVTHRDLYQILNDHEARLSYLEGRESLRPKPRGGRNDT
jgi:hypothetical protein